MRKEERENGEGKRKRERERGRGETSEKGSKNSVTIYKNVYVSVSNRS